MIIRILTFFLFIQFSCFGQGTLLYLTEETPLDSILPLQYDEHSSIWPKLDRSTPFKQCLGGFFSGDNHSQAQENP